MKSRPGWFYRQSGVIPYRIERGEVEVLLITSRNQSRWIIPKGVVEPGMSVAESACKEALEEAGIAGNVSTEPVGEYQYNKWGGTCTVTVFVLAVEKILDQWPESQQRQRKWMDAAAAAKMVREPELKKLILTMQEKAIQASRKNSSDPSS